MVEFTGRIESQSTENGDLVTVFRIPAFSARLARSRARTNARLKDFSGPEVEQTENAGPTDVPGQNIYLVTVVSNR